MDLSNIKIVFFDLETSYNTVTCWRLGKQVINHGQILRERQIISAAWLWEGSDTMNEIDWGLKKQDDYRLCKILQQELSKADIIIGQNSDKFDIKYLRGRLWHHGLPNLGCITTLDTLKLSRANLDLNSFKLDYVLKRMGDSGKIKMDLQDWIDIVEHKDKLALDKMKTYGRKDVVDTRKYFHKLLPYVDTGRLLGSLQYGNRIFKDGTVSIDATLCPNCGPTSMSIKEGTRTMRSGIRYQRRKCITCHLKYKAEKLV